MSKRREDPNTFNLNVNSSPRIDAPVDGDPIPLYQGEEKILSPDDSPTSTSDDSFVGQLPQSDKDKTLSDSIEANDEAHMSLPPLV